VVENLRLCLVADRFDPDFNRGTGIIDFLLFERLADEFDLTVLTTDIRGFRHDPSIFTDRTRPRTLRRDHRRVVTYCRSTPLLSVAAHFPAAGAAALLGKVMTAPYSIGPLDALRVVGSGPFSIELVRRLRAGRFDLVHAHGFPTALSLAALLVCLRTSTPFLFTANYHFNDPSVQHSSVLRFMARNSTSVVARTQRERAALVRIGADPLHTYVIPSTIPRAPETAGSNPPTAVSTERPASGHTALTHPWAGKGGLVVLRAIALLAAEGVNVELVTVGDPDREFLRYERELRTKGPLRVRDLGWLRSGEKDRAFESADLFVLPTMRDAFCLSILDAWRARCPVIVAKGSVQEEMVTDGVDGLLVDPGDPRKVADAIRSLLVDPGRAQSLGLAGQRHLAEGFSIDRIRSQYETVFRTTAADSLRAPGSGTIALG
jgi:glycosyltransferase involved in cell wall biosynthesis